MNTDYLKKISYKDIITRKRVLAFFLLLFIATLFWFSSELQGVFYLVVIALETYTVEFPLAAYALFFGLAVVSTLLSPFSSIVLVPLAVALWGNPITLFLLLSGWIVGGIISYYVGKYAGYNILKIILPSRFEFYRRNISRKTKFWMALLFRTATPSETGYLFGIIEYDFSRYLMATVISEIPFAVLAVYVSDALITKNIMIFEVIGLVLVAMMAISFYILRKKLKNNRSR